MIDTNYPIAALDVLLDGRCLTERYAPLIPHKTALMAGLRRSGCASKDDAARLSDADLARLGLPDAGLIPLLRRFLALYDPEPQKFREIPGAAADPAEQAAFRELYHLPGVRAVRAALYCRAGFRSLRDVAGASPEELLERTARVIAEAGLPCIPPQPKEVRTHIAVARAFTWRETDYSSEGEEKR